VPQLPNLEQPFAETNGIKAQRRNITVLFFDMVGSSALSTRLDPEDLREVLRTFQTCCENAVHSFDGHIARYMGDGILAYFGFPAALRTTPSARLRPPSRRPKLSRSCLFRARRESRCVSALRPDLWLWVT